MKYYMSEQINIEETQFLVGQNTLKDQVEQLNQSGFDVVGIGYDATFNLYFYIKEIVKQESEEVNVK